MEVQTLAISTTQTSRVSEAERAFASARYAECIRICDERDRDFDCAVLAARAAFRRRDYLDAMKRASALRLASDSDERRATVVGLLASTYGAMGDDATADRTLESAPALESLARISRLRLLYDRALISWMRGDHALAETLLRSCDYTDCPDEKAQADFLLSWVFAKRHEYAEQAALLRRSIEVLQSLDLPDVGTIGRAVHALSVISREAQVPFADVIVRKQLRSLPWTADLGYEHFHTVRNAGWRHALEGNYIPAIRNLDVAKRIAASPYWLLMSHLDHAQVAKVSGEALTFRAQIDQAVDIMDSLSADPVGDESLALVVAAEVLSEHDAVRARSALRRFDDLRRGMHASFVLSNDERTQAMYAYAAATIAEREGRTRHAISHATRAFDVFARIGFKWRSARAALLLYRCTGDDEHIAVASEHARDYARGFLRNEVEAAISIGRSGLAALTARQRQILDLLLEGLSVQEVASRLNASSNTVKTHKNRIYSVLRVRNRIELSRALAAANSRGQAL